MIFCKTNHPQLIRQLSLWLLAIAILGASQSSREEGDEIIMSDNSNVTDGNDELKSVAGFYLLNEGNMGSNKASLDYFDYETGNYSKNIYAERNPNVV
ncbi:MAG: DUF5074 domain-containing protein [Mangrovibacterium sp.]